MDRTEVCFLKSLRCALNADPMTEEPGLSGEQWEQVFQLARMHHVLPLVFEAVHRLPQLQGTPLLAAVRQQVRKQVFLQTRKTADFLMLLQKLYDADVHPLVVKGIVCRSLYPLPDHRTSSDEDLLVASGDLASCQRIFGEFGLVTTFSPERQQASYEIPYRQPEGPLYIELHKHLFPPESDSYGHLNRFFRDAPSRCVTLDVDGAKVFSLDHTDHLFYLICHALKHFLHSGFGIRQVCDIVMYIRAHSSRIQWPRLLENCRQISAVDFTAAIVRIGINHLGLQPELCPPELTADIDELPMLRDLLCAGIYGSSSESRQHSSSITLEAMASSRQNRTARNSLMLSLFPPANRLESRYPYLKDRPWLLPAAWASRIGSYCRESLLRSPASAGDSLKLGNERIALLNYYGLLKEDSASLEALL